MGCGPLQRRRADCTIGAANLLHTAPCFPHPIRPSATFPAFAEKGNPPTASSPAKGMVNSRCVNAVGSKPGGQDEVRRSGLGGAAWGPASAGGRVIMDENGARARGSNACAN